MNAAEKQIAATGKHTASSDEKQIVAGGLVGTGNESWHGKLNGYQFHKCRCEACVGAKSEASRKYAAARRQKPVPEHVHGSTNGYVNYKCRCEECRAAWAEYVQDAKERRAQKEIPEHVHGTENGYGNYGCRCEECTTAWSKGTVARSRRRRETANS